MKPDSETKAAEVSVFDSSDEENGDYDLTPLEISWYRTCFFLD